MNVVKEQTWASLGVMLREARNKKGLKQTDVEKALGYSHAAISKWERNESTPSIIQFLTLIRYYEAPWVMTEAFDIEGLLPTGHYEGSLSVDLAA